MFKERKRFLSKSRSFFKPSQLFIQQEITSIGITQLCSLTHYHLQQTGPALHRAILFNGLWRVIHLDLLPCAVREITGAGGEEEHNASTYARSGQLTIPRPNKIMQRLARWTEQHATLLDVFGQKSGRNSANLEELNKYFHVFLQNQNTHKKKSQWWLAPDCVLI